MRCLHTSVQGLTLQALSAADAKEYYALVQRNAEPLTRLGDYEAEVAASQQDIAADVADASPVPLRFGIMLDGNLVGRAGLVAVDPPKYGLGYWLSEHVTGRGQTTAAVWALLTHAAESLGATDVFAGVTHSNTKSVALLQRLGFQVAGDFDVYTRYHGRLQTLKRNENAGCRLPVDSDGCR